jgi:hypothetical protein
MIKEIDGIHRKCELLSLNRILAPTNEMEKSELNIDLPR